MHILLKLTLPVLAAIALPSCVSIGGKAPPQLLDVRSDTTPKTGANWSGTVQTATVVAAPKLPRKLDTDRVPVLYEGTNIAYLTDAHWVEKPDRLMQRMLSETLSAGGSRLILDPYMAGGRQAETLDGELLEFGVDADRQEVVIIYDAVWTRGNSLQKRRFEAREAVGDVTPTNVAPAMNRAANRVAKDVAAWMGG
jgi:cholesterol transport system auxiliary component